MIPTIFILYLLGMIPTITAVDHGQAFDYREVLIILFWPISVIVATLIVTTQALKPE